MEQEFKNQVIRLAWHDRTTFEDIEKRLGLKETDVIKLMRKEMKPSSFRMWRKRVSGRVTKHRKKFETSRKDLKAGRRAVRADSHL